jgi:hypothetical protein
MRTSDSLPPFVSCFFIALGCSASSNNVPESPMQDAAVSRDTTSSADVSTGADAPAPLGNGCAAFCGFIQRAGCPRLPPQVQPAQCMTTCENSLYVPACDRVWRAMIACLSSAAPSQFACSPAGDDLLVPSCAGQYQAAIGCIRSINNPSCYGAPCESSSDCSSRCNTTTDRCYELSATGSCVGLPCTSSSDCPSRCNTALGVCYQL